MSDKNYISGGAKQVTFKNGGNLINLSFKKDDLLKLEPNEKGYISITVAERREVDKYGNTHYMFENTYKPKANDVQGVEYKDDLPF